MCVPPTAFPLIFIKHFQRSWPLDKEGPEAVPEADSDFEEITSAEKQTVCYIVLDLLDTHIVYTYCQNSLIIKNLEQKTFCALTRFLFSQNSDGSSKTSADTQKPSEGSEATVNPVGNSSAPKKRLILSLSDKEKLLNWDTLATPEDTPINTSTNNTDQVELVIY